MFSPARFLLLGLLAPVLALTPHERCTRLARTSIKNVHSIKTTYLRANESYRIPGTCGTADLRAQPSVNVCVVNVVYNTSRTSSTRIETWLPDADKWRGRILGTGGGGFNGCVDYEDLRYGTSLNFATFGHNGGHDGESGAAFASDESLADWAHRSLHVATLTSKLLVSAYYSRVPDNVKSYYIGCSTAGRQAFRSVQDYPADFDGVLAGAPSVNSVHLLGSGGIFKQAANKLTAEDMRLASAEILRQCDAVDGRRDGIIDDPDACDFVPEVLLCAGGKKRAGCLLREQVDALRTIFSPVYGQNGEKLAPRFSPGAEAEIDMVSNVSFPQWGLDWFRYVVYKNTSWVPGPDFGLKEIADADKRDKQFPVASYKADISAFQKHGGKLLSYHGTRDHLIPYANSLLYYQLVSRTLALPPAKLDDFYRLFIIPGMNHCNRGPGAWMFGQIGFASWSNSSDSNALLALVDWVERGKAPKTLLGATPDATGKKIVGTRLHCKYPSRSVWREDKKNWVCAEAA